MKALFDNNKISIKKSSENKLSIELTIEYLLKQNFVKFDLIPNKVNFDIIADNLYKKYLSLKLIIKIYSKKIKT